MTLWIVPAWTAPIVTTAGASVKALLLSRPGRALVVAGSYGPGAFVWFPEGMLMEHGATADTDAVVVFITNKKFDIHFTENKEP